MWPFPEPTGRPTLCARLGLERSTFFFIEVQEVGAATALRDTSPLHPSACTIARTGGLDGDPHLYVSVQMAIAAARTGVSQRGASGCLMHVALAASGIGNSQDNPKHTLSPGPREKLRIWNERFLALCF